MGNLFSGNNYFIDEKVNFLEFENEYKIYDESGVQIGSVKQKLNDKQKILRLILSKSMLPFRLDIENAQGKIEASIQRGWTFFISKVKILDQNGTPIALIHQKLKLFKPKFIITDMEQHEIGEISGDWKAWIFTIRDAQGNEIGQISKKWKGLAKEIFTTADKYHVSIDPAYANPGSRKALIAFAITIDMVLKESE